MPTRTNKYHEALKRDLAAAEKLTPTAFKLKAPVTINGTTYYTMPKHGLPANPAKSLSGKSVHNHRKDCRYLFGDPTTMPTHGDLFPTGPSGPRNPRFARDTYSDPLWMYTPLVPIRKGNASESSAIKARVVYKQDSDEEHGMEAKRLDDHIAKMKLDEFTSRFPMTGRKAQIVQNMKQKYAAEIQHRLELVLYEKKEKEAAAKKLSAADEV